MKDKELIDFFLNLKPKDIKEDEIEVADKMIEITIPILIGYKTFKKESDTFANKFLSDIIAGIIMSSSNDFDDMLKNVNEVSKFTKDEIIKMEKKFIKNV